ncbi:hypothetical protein AB1K02_17135 [Novosphingobium resinovorum]
MEALAVLGALRHRISDAGGNVRAVRGQFGEEVLHPEREDAAVQA